MRYFLFEILSRRWTMPSRQTLQLLQSFFHFQGTQISRAVEFLSMFLSELHSVWNPENVCLTFLKFQRAGKGWKWTSLQELSVWRCVIFVVNGDRIFPELIAKFVSQKGKVPVQLKSQNIMAYQRRINILQNCPAFITSVVCSIWSIHQNRFWWQVFVSFGY